MSASAINFYKCETCALYVPQARTCQIMIPQKQGKISPTDYCSLYVNKIDQCEICGAGLLESIIEVIGDETHFYCQNCLIQRELQIKTQENDETPPQ